MATGSLPTISSQELARQLQQSPAPLLIDVRTPGEYAGVHVAGSINLPLHALKPEDLREQFPDRDIAVLCQAGQRAAQAQKTLQQSGIEGVVCVEGGIQAWINADLPVERGKGVIPLDRQMQIVVGLLIIVGTALGFWLHPYWLIVPGFVGLGLFNAGLTGFCPMAVFLAIMPWNRSSTSCGVRSCSTGDTAHRSE